MIGDPLFVDVSWRGAGRIEAGGTEEDDDTFNFNGTVTSTDADILILGAGGATRGVVAPLVDAGIASLTIANRTVSRAEQIAGDLLPQATIAQQVATGFNRNHPLNGEGGRIAEESRVEYVFDRVETTATVWLA